MIKRCLGCGVKLQSINEDEVGFVLDSQKDLCERCFKLKHYNKSSFDVLNYNNKDIINKINENNHYVFFLIDYFNMSEEYLSLFKQINNPKCLIITKLDLIFKSIKLKQVKDFIRNTYDIEENILFISSKKEEHLNEFNNYIKRYDIKEAYFAGITNAGKSSLINKLYEINNEKKSNIVVSNLYNTTLDFIKIKISDEFKLIDSPGFITNNYFSKITKKLNPKKYIKPITYQTKEEIYYDIENLITINTSNKNSLTFYMSNDLSIKKKYKKVDNLVKINISNDTDLIIKGLGFINIKTKCELLINKEIIDIIEIRESMF